MFSKQCPYLNNKPTGAKSQDSQAKHLEFESNSGGAERGKEQLWVKKEDVKIKEKIYIF